MATKTAIKTARTKAPPTDSMIKVGKERVSKAKFLHVARSLMTMRQSAQGQVAVSVLEDIANGKAIEEGTLKRESLRLLRSWSLVTSAGELADGIFAILASNNLKKQIRSGDYTQLAPGLK